jgi:hypothetical protein
MVIPPAPGSPGARCHLRAPHQSPNLSAPPRPASEGPGQGPVTRRPPASMAPALAHDLLYLTNGTVVLPNLALASAYSTHSIYLLLGLPFLGLGLYLALRWCRAPPPAPGQGRGGGRYGALGTRARSLTV